MTLMGFRNFRHKHVSCILVRLTKKTIIQKSYTFSCSAVKMRHLAAKISHFPLYSRWVFEQVLWLLRIFRTTSRNNQRDIGYLLCHSIAFVSNKRCLMSSNNLFVCMPHSGKLIQ